MVIVEKVKNSLATLSELMIPPELAEDLDLSQFHFQRKHWTKKCKCNKEYVYELCDVQDSAIEMESNIEDTIKVADGNKVADADADSQKLQIQKC